jgi:integrase
MKHLILNSYGMYKVRFKITTPAQSYFSNRTEINKTLGTSDYDTASSKAAIIYNSYLNIIRIMKMEILSSQQIQELVDKFIIETLQQDKIDRATLHYGVEGASCYDPVEYLNYLISESTERLSYNDYFLVLDDTKNLLRDVGIDFNASEPSHKLFQQTLMRGQIAVFKEALSRAQGIYSPKFDLPAKSKEVAVQIETKFVKTYCEAYEEFKIYYEDTHAGQLTKVDTFRVLDKLMLMVGGESPINNTRLTDLIRLKQRIENLPRLNSILYNKLSFEEVLKLTNVPDDMKITDSRAKDYIKHIKKFFTFCYQNRIIDFDPSVDLNITVDSDKKDPFSDEEAKALFAIFDAQEPHARLLLYIYPFTGMRREEPYNSTIQEENGIKYFEITDGKNTYAKRKIPLHARLIALGLDTNTFTQAKAKVSYAALGKLFNQRLKPQVTSSSKNTLHSWRHTVATKLQHEGIVDSLIQNILGHSATDTLNRVYAREKTNLKAMQEAIEKIAY